MIIVNLSFSVMPEQATGRRQTVSPASMSNKRRRLMDGPNVNRDAWSPPDPDDSATHASENERPESSPSPPLTSYPSAFKVDTTGRPEHSITANQQRDAVGQLPPLTPASSASAHNNDGPDIDAALMSANIAASQSHHQEQQHVPLSALSPQELLVMDPSFLTSQAVFSRSLPPSPDDYASNPTFLASQEELRSLLFNTAQSTQPTRAPSPDLGGAEYGLGIADGVAEAAGAVSTPGQNQMKQILGTRRRIEYLKNYIAKVAPWVSVYTCSNPFLAFLLPLSLKRCSPRRHGLLSTKMHALA